MIDVKQLGYIYRKSGKEAVKGIDFTIDKGEIFGLLGPSGAGKTTTQRLLIGLLRGYKGSIQVLGKERSKWDRSYYEQVGVAFDFPNLYLKLTAKENLDLIGSYYANPIRSSEALLDMVGLLPDRDVRVESFSKGMKMRLNFVRALIHNPDIIFFDEPTSGLDPVNAKTIKDTIVRLREEGKTIFLTTHNMTVAEQLCNRVAFMSQGRLPVTDAPSNLMVAYGENRLDVRCKDGSTKAFPMAGLGDNKDFQNLLVKGAVQSMHTKEASLEEIFIQLTGEQL